MPLTTYVGTSEMTEVIPVELIPKVIAGYEYEPGVAESIAWFRDGQGNVPARFVRWNELAVPAGTVAETVDHPDVNVDLTESSITPAMVRFRVPVSDEAAAAAEAGIPLGLLKAIVDALRARMDEDALSVSTSATLQIGAVGQAFGLAEFHTARQFYRASRIDQFGARHALVLHYDALSSLENSIRNSSSPWVLQKDDALRMAVGGAYQGTMAGVDVFVSGNVADESTGHSNFMTPMGSGQSGLGVVVNEMPSIRPTRGTEGETRATTFYHGRMWYGTGIANPRRFLEILSA